MLKSGSMRYVLGVDEAGRGPLAGPVAVGIVRVPVGFDVAKGFPGVKDSKKLSEKKREKIFAMLEKRAEQGEVRYAVEFEDERTIDEEGIAAAVSRAVARGISVLEPNFRHPMSEIRILLDGSLKAPPRYPQQTIIRGDETEPIISLASIAAKVMRDRRMAALALEYPHYGFDEHKGYGTPGHYKALVLHGPCAIHRRTYLHLDLSRSGV